jgi:hypothetical protein
MSFIPVPVIKDQNKEDKINSTCSAKKGEGKRKGDFGRNVRRKRTTRKIYTSVEEYCGNGSIFGKS